MKELQKTNTTTKMHFQTGVYNKIHKPMKTVTVLANVYELYGKNTVVCLLAFYSLSQSHTNKPAFSGLIGNLTTYFDEFTEALHT